MKNKNLQFCPTTEVKRWLDRAELIGLTPSDLINRILGSNPHSDDMTLVETEVRFHAQVEEPAKAKLLDSLCGQ